jgi:hypothetical protein
MLCEPCANPLVAKDVVPEAFSVPEPSTVAPSRKLTVPVGAGVLEPTPATMAVNEMDAASPAGLAEEASVVVVLTFPGASIT